MIESSNAGLLNKASEIVHRFHCNPLFRPSDIPPSNPGMEVVCAFNPAATRFDGKRVLLIRVAERPIQEKGYVSTAILDSESGELKILRFRLDDPDLDRVLVREIARSPEIGRRVEESRGVFDALERMIARAQEDGQMRADADPKLLTWVFYGAMEEIMTAWVLAQLPDGPEDVARAVDTVVDLVCDGLAPQPAAA